MIAGLDSNAAGTGTSGAEKLLLSSMYRKLIVNVVLVWFLILELFIWLLQLLVYGFSLKYPMKKINSAVYLVKILNCLYKEIFHLKYDNLSRSLVITLATGFNWGRKEIQWMSYTSNSSICVSSGLHISVIRMKSKHLGYV
jgi:hypothetical protein